MLAAVVRRYGPPEVVEVEQFPGPMPAAGQLRVRVRAASLNPLDTKLRSGGLRPFLRLRFPAVLGFDLAGEVEALGPGAQGFAIGERVYGRTDARTGGTHAELAVVATGVLDRIPANVSFAQAASLPLAGMTALQALRDASGLRGGQRLLVNGAAGGVGSLAIQIGRALGAEVTGVCSGAASDVVTRLGATRVLDYTRGDLARDAGPYDVILDTVTNRSYRDFARLLGPRGVYVTTGISIGLALRATLGRIWSAKRVRFLVSHADGALMRALSEMVTAGRVSPVINSTFSLENVRDAHRRVETGHVHGKVVLTIP